MFDLCEVPTLVVSRDGNRYMLRLYRKGKRINLNYPCHQCWRDNLFEVDDEIAFNKQHYPNLNVIWS